MIRKQQKAAKIIQDCAIKNATDKAKIIFNTESINEIDSWEELADTESTPENIKDAINSCLQLLASSASKIFDNLEELVEINKKEEVDKLTKRYTKKIFEFNSTSRFIATSRRSNIHVAIENKWKPNGDPVDKKRDAEVKKIEKIKRKSKIHEIRKEAKEVVDKLNECIQIDINDIIKDPEDRRIYVQNTSAILIDIIYAESKKFFDHCDPDLVSNYIEILKDIPHGDMLMLSRLSTSEQLIFKVSFAGNVSAWINALMIIKKATNKANCSAIDAYMDSSEDLVTTCLTNLKNIQHAINIATEEIDKIKEDSHTKFIKGVLPYVPTNMAYYFPLYFVESVEDISVNPDIELITQYNQWLTSNIPFMSGSDLNDNSDSDTEDDDRLYCIEYRSDDLTGPTGGGY